MNSIEKAILCFGILILFSNYLIADNDIQAKMPQVQDVVNQYSPGSYSQSDTLITYSVPKEFPLEGKSLFSIKVNGKYTGVYNDVNAWDKLVNFGYFDFKPGNEIELEINCSIPFIKYKIFSNKSRAEVARHGQIISFKIKEPQALTIVFDDNYQGNVLHIFANSIDENAPDSSSESLIYFGPGYHNLDGSLKVSGKQKVYIAGGAVVDGNLTIENADGAVVSGRGMLMRQVSKNVVLGCAFSNNVTVDGIMIHNHRSGDWTAALHAVSNVTVKNVNIISTRYASTDGFDIVNSSGIHFDNVFIRSCDDCIAIKGLIEGKPADCPANENMRFENMQLWNDCNNSICLGAETRAVCYKNIIFNNIDVLYSYDDRDHHTMLDERSVMSIVCLNGTYFSDISFSNFNVNCCQRLICLTFKDSFWFGSIQGNQATGGGIKGVVFKNIESESSSGSPISNQILLNGWMKDGTPVKYVEDITFEDVVIENEALTGENNKWLKTNNTERIKLVRGLKFKASTSKD